MTYNAKNNSTSSNFVIDIEASTTSRALSSYRICFFVQVGPISWVRNLEKNAVVAVVEAVVEVVVVAVVAVVEASSFEYVL